MTKKTILMVSLVMILMLCIGQTAFADTGDANIVRQFVVDDPHHGEYCTEDADTVRAFGPGTEYGPIITNGVEDPLFAKGGYLFGPTDQGTMKIYAIAVDFTDAIGDVQIPYGRHRNVVKSAHGGTVYDYSDPQIHFESQFKGTDVLKANPKFTWLGTAAQEYKGIEQILEEQSMGRLEVDVELLNERLAQVKGIDTTVERTPWFHIDGPIFAYSNAGPADCEDYRQFARLYQAAIYAAVEQLEEAGLTSEILGQGSNIEDIGFLYIITPFNAFGYRLGFQGGGGIMSSYSFNEQVLAQRDSEYRHVPGVLTPGGRMVGSGVFGMKGLVNPGNSNNISPNIGNALHELTHGLGMFDDYSYGGLGTNAGEATASGAGNWGVMGSNMRTVSPDLPVWRKFRMGYIEDEEIKVVLPGDQSIDIYLRALGSAPGQDGGTYTNDPSIKTRMIVIPKEYRTRDTFGVNWANGWNPFKDKYNWYDWFTNIYVGGETYAIKSFPTFYTIESRRALGADGNPLGTYSGLPEARKGVVVDYIANPTWETGHGAGGFKVMTGDNGLKEGVAWSDPNIGLTISVLEAGDYYDKVRIQYTGTAMNTAKHVYQGSLTASDNHVSKNPGDPFTVDFNLVTFGSPAPNDSVNNATTLSAVVRPATPLGVPGGISGFTMEVMFDAALFEYVSTGSAPFTYSVNTDNAAAGKLLITAEGTKMIDKDTILSVNFKTKTGAAIGAYKVDANMTDVKLINWRGETLVKGAPGFDGVGTFGNGTLAALYNTVANNDLAADYINSIGGRVIVGEAATYTVSGSIVCDTPGPAAGSWIGIESVVQLYDGDNNPVGASVKSDWDGNYTIKGVPAGTGYTVAAEKSKYVGGKSAAFAVAGADVSVPELKLLRQTYPVSGTIYGAFNSDGSGKTPIADVDVYVISIGNGYRVLGGPAKTNAQGQYTVYATTDSTDKNFAGLAVKSDGNAAKYGTQITLFEKDDITGKQIGDLDLNMGTQAHMILDDWVYPANTERLGAGGTFAFSLGGADSLVVTGRDLTLTETQDVHLRTVTKSADIYYQLRALSDGAAVGEKVKSVGTANGDDMIRNVPPGRYYIELTREGYVSVNTMPIAVDTTRVLLRDAQTTNSIDINTPLGANVVSGTVVDNETGLPVKAVSIVFESWSNTGGRGNPVSCEADGTFSYDVTADDKELYVSAPGYVSQAINVPAAAATTLDVRLDRADTGVMLKLKLDKVYLNAGDYFNVETAVSEPLESNVVVLDYTFDTSLIEYANCAPAAGVTLISWEHTAAGVQLKLMVPDYGMAQIASVMFRAKEKIAETESLFTVVGQFVVRDADEKEVLILSNVVGFNPPIDPDLFNLILLSDVIDAFGKSSAGADWIKYRQYDFDQNGVIDIVDIVYVASRIK